MRDREIDEYIQRKRENERERKGGMEGGREGKIEREKGREKNMEGWREKQRDRRTHTGRDRDREREEGGREKKMQKEKKRTSGYGIPGKYYILRCILKSPQARYQYNFYRTIPAVRDGLKSNSQGQYFILPSMEEVMTVFLSSRA